jgi:hypothetical protein
MLLGGASERLRRSDILVKLPLKLVESNVASTIGGYLVDMGAPTLPVDTSSRYFQHARGTAHDAGNPACWLPRSFTATHPPRRTPPLLFAA